MIYRKAFRTAKEMFLENKGKLNMIVTLYFCESALEKSPKHSEYG